MTEMPYVGSELDLFSACVRWKSYFSRVLRPHVGASVLEVGAGIGANTAFCCGDSVQRWVCLEPDSVLARRIQDRVVAGELPRCCEVRVGTVADLSAAEVFDTAIYIDVLEHIDDDRGELRRIAGFLRAGGRLVVLAPAHQYLYSAFDRAIGHYRRYDRASLRGISPPELECIDIQYLDSAGLAASLANRWILWRSMPDPRQLRFWDSVLVPASTWLDPLLRNRIGKSVVGIWQKRQ